MNQRELVERARRGDHDAFAELAGAFVARLDAAARLILRDHELARDAVQEGFIGAWRNLPTLRDPDRFEAWLRRPVVRSCINTLAIAAVSDRGRAVTGRRTAPATRAIPAGTTGTYGEIARAIGAPEAARDVGAALARNPTPIIVPCHRVGGANGKLTGFSAPGGIATKRRMPALEGAPGFGQLALFG